MAFNMAEEEGPSAVVASCLSMSRVKMPAMAGLVQAVAQ